MPEAVFKEEVEQVIQIYEREIGHAATRTRPMIEKYGEIVALSKIVVSPDLQKGFKVLRDSGQLDKTFEALVVRFNHYFEPEVVESAKWRIENAEHLL
jgi:hypothetical protein